ncbi:hypothetical protein BJV82DRAFT_158774 [Fennellomyces sp. T-0311]|nr:hypothetical protein BJV82DRAFT_158774 [Fennellomyces sp. T-0311]
MSNSSMWFDGPVAEAVSLVNTKNCVFVVYIYDDSANSQQLDATLDNPAVVQKISSQTVALKMQKDSDNAKLFQQLYPTPHVPILYFIRQGTIKDFGKEDTTPEEIVAKIDKASGSPVPSPTQPASSPTVSSPAVSTPAPAAAATSSSSSSSPTPANDSSNLSKKEKLRKQMEEARKKREEKEKQEARDRETKRREDGKMMQQTREQMEDQRNKQHFAKIKKEKKEDEEHRRKIKEQIARDRAEQIAARQAAKQRSKSETSSTSPRPSSNSSGQHNTSSISIRQLDGSTIRNKFQASDTLGAVKDWIDKNRTDGDQPYKLLAQFPTRQFSIGEEQHTLRDLDLCPSATIIMKAIKNVSNAYGASDGYGMMDYVYSAGGMLYNAASTVGSTMSGVVYSLFPSEQTVSSGSSPTVGGFPSSSTFNGGQRLGGESSNRPTSNVNTLRASEFDDNDDDRRTYNGNSLNQE